MMTTVIAIIVKIMINQSKHFMNQGKSFNLIIKLVAIAFTQNFFKIIKTQEELYLVLQFITVSLDFTFKINCQQTNLNQEPK